MNIREFVSCLNKREMIERKSMTEQEVIDAVKLNKFFGFVECDIEVPHNLRSKFHKMPPIFKNVNISRNDLSPHMQDFAVKTGTLKAPQRLIMYGEKILLLTTLLQRYIKQGLKVSKVYQFTQFKRSKCFIKFWQEVCDTRWEGSQLVWNSL